MRKKQKRSLVRVWDFTLFTSELANYPAPVSATVSKMLVRMETLGSKAKDFVTHSTTSSMNLMLYHLSLPSPPKS